MIALVSRPEGRAERAREGVEGREDQRTSLWVLCSLTLSFFSLPLLSPSERGGVVMPTLRAIALGHT